MKLKLSMGFHKFFKAFSIIIDVLILVSIFSPMVYALPFIEEIKSRTLNNDISDLFNEVNEQIDGFSSEKFINLQKTNGFDFFKEAEQTIKSTYDRLQNLFLLPFVHPIIQGTKNESEIYRGDCPVPDNIFSKKKNTNLCTVCEDEMSLATELIYFFLEVENVRELLEIGEKCKHVLNEYLFNYALTYVLITKFPDIKFPPIIEVFPVLFIKKDELDHINKEMFEKPRHKRMTGPIVRVRPSFESASLTYFTEDYGFNSNHWNWHIIHRTTSRIDRRGELFWFMHHQMLARYDIERLGVGLNRVESSGPLNRRLDVGFFPNLDTSENGEEWASRQDGILPRSIRSNGRVVQDIADLTLWHGRLSKAARDGFMLNKNNERIVLSDDTEIRNGAKRGIDIFTGTAESDPLISPDADHYGILHNHGHRIVSKQHDTESRGRSSGVMASAAVSARDPSFYQWHKYIEIVIQEYKITQAPYTQQRLELENIILSDVQVAVDLENFSSYKRQNGFRSSENRDSWYLETAEGELLTGCNTYGVDISRGIDFGHQGDQVILELTHLDHVPFYYNIYVVNGRLVNKNIMVRILMAPVYGNDGQRLQLHEQRHLFIILDKFQHTLRPGENVIHRLSTESSITSNCRSSRSDNEAQRFGGSGVFGGGHCGCGWPQHLLLPRGRRDGMTFKIFVLLTDADQDDIPSNIRVKEFCGQSGEKHGDWQPMGYPFDRPFDQNIQYVDQLADFLVNAHVTDVSIRFTGRNILTNNFSC